MPNLQKALVEVTPGVIVDAVDELLLVQRGRELGYTLGNEQFQSIIANIKKENKLESDEQFQAALKQEGMTLDDLRKNLERNLLVTRVQQVEVMGKISVNEEEVAKYYEANKDSFTSAPSVTLREILVAVPESDKGINVGADDDARAKAEDLRKRVLAGEPFAQLASSSSDSGSKANGGLIGPISRDDLSPDLQKNLASMKPGDVTPIIRTTRGYQIIKLENATTAHTKSLDEARADVSEKLARNTSVGSAAGVSDPPARAGDHRLEERGNQESVRGRRQAAADGRILMGHADVLTPEISAAGFEWYAIWTRSRHEKLVRDQLDPEAG